MSGKHKGHSKSKSSPAKKAKVTKKHKTFDSDDVAKKHKTFNSDAAAKKHTVRSFNSVIIESPTMKGYPKDPEASEDEIQVCYEGLGSPTMQENPEDSASEDKIHVYSERLGSPKVQEDLEDLEASGDEYYTYSDLFRSPKHCKDSEASEDEIHVYSEGLGSPTMQEDPENPEAPEDEIHVYSEGLGFPTMQEASEDEYHTYFDLFGSPRDRKAPEASEDEIHVCSEESGSSNIQNNYDCLQLHLTPETFFFAPPPDSDDIDRSNICVKCHKPISDEPDVESSDEEERIIIQEDHPWYSSYTSVKNSHQPLLPKDNSVLSVIMELPIRQRGPEDQEASKDEIHVCSEGLGSSNNQNNVLLREVPCSNAMPVSSNHNDFIRVEIPLYKIKIDHLLKARSKHHSSKDVVFMPKKISDVKK